METVTPKGITEKEVILQDYLKNIYFTKQAQFSVTLDEPFNIYLPTT